MADNKNIVAKTEYALEIYDKYGFVKQIDVYGEYEKALDEKNNYKGPLFGGEYLKINYIDYDKDGNEIGFGEA